MGWWRSSLPRWELLYTQDGATAPQIPYLEFAVLFGTLLWAFETYLMLRQYWRIQLLQGKVPEELAVFSSAVEITERPEVAATPTSSGDATGSTGSIDERDAAAASGGAEDNGGGPTGSSGQENDRGRFGSEAEVEDFVHGLGYHELRSEVSSRKLQVANRKKETLQKALLGSLLESLPAPSSATAVAVEDVATAPGESGRPASKTTQKDQEKKPQSILEKLQSTETKTFRYNADSMQYNICYSLWSRVLDTALLLAGFSPFIWDQTKSFLLVFGVQASSWPILHAVAFAQICSIIEALAEVPWNAYSTFSVEARHGFNKTTVPTFVMDIVKSLALQLTLGSAILAGLLGVASWADIEGRGDLFFVYVWVFGAAIMLSLTVIAPTLIMPLFYTFTPLEDRSLKAEIEQVAAQPEVQFPVTKIFVMDGSKRSAHSNAFFFGLFKDKRVVLFDTLLTQVTNSELIAVLCHEFGHWKHGHIIQNFVVVQAFSLATLYCFALVRNDAEIYGAFGFADQNLIVGLNLFIRTIWAPVLTAFGYINTLETRRKEFEADRFASRCGHADGLERGLLKLSLENMSNLDPDPWYSAFNHTHPPLIQRLRAITHDKVKREKTQ
mmetsp:Transcript_16445/g.62463  ORF Transcript_16445/g.62463 Transcript_16445/m.62463 type:complete len:612 (-) Transcript_16445:756-2591(-)